MVHITHREVKKMALELIFIIISVLVALVVSITTVVSFIKQPYRSEETEINEPRKAALQRAHEAMQRFEHAALESRHREEDLLHLLAEYPQMEAEVKQILHQHNVALRQNIETLADYEKELQRVLQTLPPTDHPKDGSKPR
jgi:flagellar basal body-associated protein FliL